MKSSLFLLALVVQAIGQTYEPQHLGALNKFIFTNSAPRAFQYEVRKTGNLSLDRLSPVPSSHWRDAADQRLDSLAI
jgi:hypothetical protein